MIKKSINSNFQQIHASNISSNISEALDARIKDPLWFLSRQWQTGEFQAKNGGRPVQTSIDFCQHPFEEVTLYQKSDFNNSNNPFPAKKVSVDQADPLEAIIEAENDSGDALSWQAASLEYEFELKAAKHKFKATNYNGHCLDWSNFQYSDTVTESTTKTQSIRVNPTQLYFKGAPHPRWWRFEEGHAYFDSPVDPEPNVLSLLLPEFFYTDINNWYTAPLPVTSGSLLEVKSIRIFDSFGVMTEIDPINKDNSDSQWSMFSINSEDSNKSQLTGSYLMCPNVAIEILDNHDIEEIRFARDEASNMVWAWERRFTDNKVTHTAKRETVGGPEEEPKDVLPQFILKSSTARHWIPYIPQYIAHNSSVNGEIRLRRARTDETAGEKDPVTGERNAPQYRSKIVEESKILHEEEIPITGLRIRRIKRFARGSNGKPYSWTGRIKETANRAVKPGIKFDYLK